MNEFFFFSNKTISIFFCKVFSAYCRTITMNILFGITYVVEEQRLIEKFITILVILVTNPVNSLSLANIQSSSVISLRNFLIPSNF